MPRKIEGLRRAEVVDTSEFADLGKIKIRAMGLMPEDAWEYADVLTPFGGLPNMGMQALPPIGSIGFVLYERESEIDPVWVGGLLRSFGEELDEGYANPVEGEDPSDFVIKTQYTQSDDQELQGTGNKVENILKMNEGEITVAKVRQDSDSYEYKTEAYDMEEQAYNLLKITDEEFKIKFKFSDNSKSNTISVNEERVELSFDTDSGEKTININEDTIELTSGSSVIIINKDGDVEVNTDAKIKLNGDDNTGVLYEPLRDFINQTYNSHTHGTPAGPSSPPTSPYSNSNSMKSKSVKLT